MISLWHSHVDFYRLISFCGFILIRMKFSGAKISEYNFWCLLSALYLSMQREIVYANSKTRIYTHIVMVFFFFYFHNTPRTSSHLHSLFSLILSRWLPPTSLKFLFSMNSNEISLSFYVNNKPLSHDKHINHNTNLCIYAKDRERGRELCMWLYVLLSIQEGDMMTTRWAGDKSKIRCTQICGLFACETWA